jgi:hypothetical protein
MKWSLYYNCELHNVYNTTTCAEMYALLPTCLEHIDYALDVSTPETRRDALRTCIPLLEGDNHDTDMLNVRRKAGIYLL